MNKKQQYSNPNPYNNGKKGPKKCVFVCSFGYIVRPHFVFLFVRLISLCVPTLQNLGRVCYIVHPHSNLSFVCDTLYNKLHDTLYDILHCILHDTLYNTLYNILHTQIVRLAEQCHSQNFYLWCFKSDVDAVKSKIDLFIIRYMTRHITRGIIQHIT